MALTIQAFPVNYASVNDDLVYTVADIAKVSDPVTYPNFKFIGDVYIGATLAARIRKIPDPSTGIGIFNVWQIVRSYMAAAFNPTFGTLVAQRLGDTMAHLAVTMKFGESWGGTDTVNINIDSTRYFFNNYSGRGSGPNTSMVIVLDKIASFRPTTMEALKGSNWLFLPYFPTTTALVHVTITPIGGGLTLSTTFTPDNAYDIQVLNLAPNNLNAIQPGTITAATSGYTVQVAAQIYTVNLICESIYAPATLHFMNKIGGFETKVFSKLSRHTFDITKSTYGKQRFVVDSSGNVNYATTSKVYNESTAVYVSQYKEKRQLNTDILTDAEYDWLEDLLISPLVYKEEDNGDFFPVAITDTNYEAKRHINDGITNLAVNIEYGQNLASQFR